MVLDPAKVRTYATAEAFARGHMRVADVPAAQRDGLVAAVATELRAPSAEVRAILAADWNETHGRAGQSLTGASAVGPSSTARRAVAAQGATPASLMIAGQKARNAVGAAPTTPPDVARRADAIDRALRGDAPTRVTDEVPYDQLPLVMRRNVALDAKVIRPGLDGAPDSAVRTGDYGAIVLAKLSPDDPILDLPLYRGMGSSDPAVHALRLTGQLVPGGSSNDYEGFKTYSHRAPLDAFEWTLDPFVAMKGAGGHGYLLRTTLRELRDAGQRDVARKVGDTEGGLFIDGPIKPTVRSLGHLPGSYAIGAPIESAADPKRARFAELLAKRLPEVGGYGGLEDGADRLAEPLAKQALVEQRAQATFWLDRLEELEPGSALGKRAAARLAALDAEPSVDTRRAGVRAVTDELKLRVAAQLPPPSDDPFGLG